jgi:hypothetical protein
VALKLAGDDAYSDKTSTTTYSAKILYTEYSDGYLSTEVSWVAYPRLAMFLPDPVATELSLASAVSVSRFLLLMPRFDDLAGTQI